MKKEVREILEQPFPPGVIKQREESHGRKHDHVERRAVTLCAKSPSSTGISCGERQVSR
jgi:hypothetical protein